MELINLIFIVMGIYFIYHETVEEYNDKLSEMSQKESLPGNVYYGLATE